jgi:hypothetical protein
MPKEKNGECIYSNGEQSNEPEDFLQLLIVSAYNMYRTWARFMKTRKGFFHLLGKEKMN